MPLRFDSNSSPLPQAGRNRRRRRSRSGGGPGGGGGRILDFGRHAGRSYEEVFRRERSYVQWALRMTQPGGGLQHFQRWIRTRMGNHVTSEEEFEGDVDPSDEEDESPVREGIQTYGTSDAGSESTEEEAEAPQARRHPHQPCPADVVAQLPRLAYSSRLFSGEPYPEACPICMENFEPAESGAMDRQIVLTPCLHAFHEPCLSSWFRKHVECPTCRWDVTNMGEVASHSPDNNTPGSAQPLPSLVTPAELVGQTVVLSDDSE